MTIKTLPLTDLGSAAAAVVENLPVTPPSLTSVVEAARIVKHEPGVYFGLPDAEYFKDPALGSTDIKRLIISPADYWGGSLYNPHREQESSRYLDRGHGIHAYVLFGHEFFERHYERQIQKSDFPDALVTIDDLRRALRQIEMAVSGKKEELIARIKSSSTRFQIWDDLVAAQEKTGKTILKPDDCDRILIAAAMIQKNPALANCFENGIPEVSIFWEQDGVRFRSRIDWLRLNSSVDLKSFTNPMDRPMAQAIESSFWNQRHDLQASLYLTARTVMRRFIKEGRVFGDVDRDWLNKLAEVEDDVFVFVYFKMEGATVTRGKWIRRGGHIDGAAGVIIERAADIWRENWKLFGDSMWVDMAPLEEMTENEVPGWIRW